MTTIAYPSELFPGPPSVAVDLPADWTAVRVPGTLLAARRTDSDGRFAPNLVIRGFTRSGDFSLGMALRELKEFVDQRDGGTMDDPFEVSIDEVPYVGINVSWTDDNVGDVVQAHLFAGARRGQVIDLVQVTGSVGGEHVATQYETVQQVMQTVRITR